MSTTQTILKILYDNKDSEVEKIGIGFHMVIIYTHHTFTNRNT